MNSKIIKEYKISKISYNYPGIGSSLIFIKFFIGTEKQVKIEIEKLKIERNCKFDFHYEEI